VVPRVLVVHPGPLVEDCEAVVAGDGPVALSMLSRERFDVVVVDCSHPPLDGWCVLAALGCRPAAQRPAVLVLVPGSADLARAFVLGADSCAPAGTPVDARALVRFAEPSKENIAWPAPRTTDSPRPTRVGASA
jgi:CheY-like chemotaxis protein